MRLPTRARTALVIAAIALAGCGGAATPDASLDAGALDGDTLDAGTPDVGTPDAAPDAARFIPPLAPLDAYGGALGLPIPNTTGYFTVATAYGRSWLVTPAGHAFVSFGINHVGPAPDTDRVTGRSPYGDFVAAHYASDATWSDATVARMSAWTFNTIGAWSNDDLFTGRVPVTPVLSFAGSGWKVGACPDVFDPAWEASAMTGAAVAVSSRADDPWVVGWFLDNELRWGPDWRSTDDLFDAFLSLPADAPGKLALVAFARDQFAGDVTAFDAAFGTSLASFDELAGVTAIAVTPASADARHAWSGTVADRYFSVASAAVRAADPHHLVLGCRFVSWLAPPSVVEAAGRHVDVVSVNHYEISAMGRGILHAVPSFAYSLSTDDWLAAFASTSGKPLLISEFGARAADSGLPNTYPPSLFQIVWHTQAERADALERYGDAMAQKPYLVGVHWFEWVDEPPGGRFDGEDSNWGLVSNDDVPYAAVVDRAPLVGPMLTYAR